MCGHLCQQHLARCRTNVLCEPSRRVRRDEAARAHAARDAEQRSPAAAAGYYAEGAFDLADIRARLAKVTAPVLVLAGEVDLSPTPGRAAEAAALFPSAEVAVQPGAGISYG